MTSESVQDVAAGPDGSVWASALQASEVRKLGGDETTSTGPQEAIGVPVDLDGNVYVASSGNNVHNVIRFDKTGSGFVKAKTLGGFQEPGDVEVSKDGSLYAVDGLA